MRHARSHEMQELSRVALVDFLACLVAPLCLVHKPAPRFQAVLPFIPPVEIIRRKDNVVRAEDVLGQAIAGQARQPWFLHP